jgi:hypothetical protein
MKKHNKRSSKVNRSAMPERAKKALRLYAVAVLSIALAFGAGTTAFAADDPIQMVNNLSDFIFGLIRAIGMILIGFGVVQVGLSLKSHDPSQRANGFMTLAGGIIIMLAKEILALITG